jgi:maltose O-acetyltransferase
MYIGFLIRNRSRPAFGSHAWLKSWAKRIRLIPQLLAFEARILSLRRRGARIGQLSTLSPGDISGRISNLSIGDHCAIGRIAIQLHDRVDIGNCVVINDGTRILTGSHDVHSSNWELVTSPVRIDDYAWIATGAMLLPGVEIGRGAVVAAGAVVTKSVAPMSIVGGNPAREIGRRAVDDFSYCPVRQMALIEAWLGNERAHPTQTHPNEGREPEEKLVSRPVEGREPDQSLIGRPVEGTESEEIARVFE